MNGRASFIVASARATVEWVSRNFTRRTSCVLIQFPTPFALVSSKYLPELESYMIDEGLLQQVLASLCPTGTMIFQTFAEDVAIHFRELAEAVGFVADVDVEGDSLEAASADVNADRFQPNSKYDRVP